ncbi:unnamed protein product [Meganyctiphanes norvegica]|uniref:Uncharacterized protein n=1 Tax=Meganyctiphanes norvegica TaxID=48144 RepID=A0AAV2R8J2_MEGNR
MSTQIDNIKGQNNIEKSFEVPQSNNNNYEEGISHRSEIIDRPKKIQTSITAKGINALLQCFKHDKDANKLVCIFCLESFNSGPKTLLVLAWHMNLNHLSELSKDSNTMKTPIPQSSPDNNLSELSMDSNTMKTPTPQPTPGNHLSGLSKDSNTMKIPTPQPSPDTTQGINYKQIQEVNSEELISSSTPGVVREVNSIQNVPSNTPNFPTTMQDLTSSNNNFLNPFQPAVSSRQNNDSQWQESILANYIYQRQMLQNVPPQSYIYQQHPHFQNPFYRDMFQNVSNKSNQTHFLSHTPTEINSLEYTSSKIPSEISKVPDCHQPPPLQQNNNSEAEENISEQQLISDNRSYIEQYEKFYSNTKYREIEQLIQQKQQKNLELKQFKQLLQQNQQNQHQYKNQQPLLVQNEKPNLHRKESSFNVTHSGILEKQQNSASIMMQNRSYHLPYVIPPPPIQHPDYSIHRDTSQSISHNDLSYYYGQDYNHQEISDSSQHAAVSQLSSDTLLNYLLSVQTDNGLICYTCQKVVKPRNAFAHLYFGPVKCLNCEKMLSCLEPIGIEKKSCDHKQVEFIYTNPLIFLVRFLVSRHNSCNDIFVEYLKKLIPVCKFNPWRDQFQKLIISIKITTQAIITAKKNKYSKVQFKPNGIFWTGNDENVRLFNLLNDNETLSLVKVYQEITHHIIDKKLQNALGLNALIDNNLESSKLHEKVNKYDYKNLKPYNKDQTVDSVENTAEVDVYNSDEERPLQIVEDDDQVGNEKKKEKGIQNKVNKTHYSNKDQMKKYERTDRNSWIQGIQSAIKEKIDSNTDLKKKEVNLITSNEKNILNANIIVQKILSANSKYPINVEDSFHRESQVHHNKDGENGFVIKTLNKRCEKSNHSTVHNDNSKSKNCIKNNKEDILIRELSVLQNTQNENLHKEKNLKKSYTYEMVKKSANNISINKVDLKQRNSNEELIQIKSTEQNSNKKAIKLNSVEKESYIQLENKSVYTKENKIQCTQEENCDDTSKLVFDSHDKISEEENMRKSKTEPLKTTEYQKEGNNKVIDYQAMIKEHLILRNDSRLINSGQNASGSNEVLRKNYVKANLDINADSSRQGDNPKSQDVISENIQKMQMVKIGTGSINLENIKNKAKNKIAITEKHIGCVKSSTKDIEPNLQKYNSNLNSIEENPNILIIHNNNLKLNETTGSISIEKEKSIPRDEPSSKRGDISVIFETDLERNELHENDKLFNELKLIDDHKSKQISSKFTYKLHCLRDDNIKNGSTEHPNLCYTNTASKGYEQIFCQNTAEKSKKDIYLMNENETNSKCNSKIERKIKPSSNKGSESSSRNIQIFSKKKCRINKRKNRHIGKSFKYNIRLNHKHHKSKILSSKLEESKENNKKIKLLKSVFSTSSRRNSDICTKNVSTSKNKNISNLQKDDTTKKPPVAIQKLITLKNHVQYRMDEIEGELENIVCNRDKIHRKNEFVKICLGNDEYNSNKCSNLGVFDNLQKETIQKEETLLDDKHNKPEQSITKQIFEEFSNNIKCVQPAEEKNIKTAFCFKSDNHKNILDEINDETRNIEDNNIAEEPHTVNRMYKWKIEDINKISKKIHDAKERIQTQMEILHGYMEDSIQCNEEIIQFQEAAQVSQYNEREENNSNVTEKDLNTKYDQIYIANTTEKYNKKAYNNPLVKDQTDIFQNNDTNSSKICKNTFKFESSKEGIEDDVQSQKLSNIFIKQFNKTISEIEKTREHIQQQMNCEYEEQRLPDNCTNFGECKFNMINFKSEGDHSQIVVNVILKEIKKVRKQLKEQRNNVVNAYDTIFKAREKLHSQIKMMQLDLNKVQSEKEKSLDFNENIKKIVNTADPKNETCIKMNFKQNEDRVNGNHVEKYSKEKICSTADYLEKNIDVVANTECHMRVTDSRDLNESKKNKHYTNSHGKKNEINDLTSQISGSIENYSKICTHKNNSDKIEGEIEKTLSTDSDRIEGEIERKKLAASCIENSGDQNMNDKDVDPHVAFVDNNKCETINSKIKDTYDSFQICIDFEKSANYENVKIDNFIGDNVSKQSHVTKTQTGLETSIQTCTEKQFQGQNHSGINRLLKNSDINHINKEKQEVTSLEDQNKNIENYNKDNSSTDFGTFTEHFSCTDTASNLNDKEITKDLQHKRKKRKLPPLRSIYEMNSGFKRLKKEYQNNSNITESVLCDLNGITKHSSCSSSIEDIICTQKVFANNNSTCNIETLEGKFPLSFTEEVSIKDEELIIKNEDEGQDFNIDVNKEDFQSNKDHFDLIKEKPVPEKYKTIKDTVPEVKEEKNLKDNVNSTDSNCYVSSKVVKRCPVCRHKINLTCDNDNQMLTTVCSCGLTIYVLLDPDDEDKPVKRYPKRMKRENNKNKN